MGLLLPRIVHAKKILRGSLFTTNQGASLSLEVPKGHFPIYVGENHKKRFVIPVSYLNHPLIQDLLSQAEEEFGFDYPMGGLTIPCRADVFADLMSSLDRS